MSWNTMQEFVAMGGYATYVWGSCGVTLAALAIESLVVRRRLRRILLSMAESRRPA